MSTLNAEAERKREELLPKNRWLLRGWFGVHLLLIIALGIFLWGTFERVSQQSYLRGFAEAIIPLGGKEEEVITAILNWFKKPPRRFDHSPVPKAQDADPRVTLDTQELLQICGTASYAFHRLSRVVGIPSRLLLLLDERGLTRHVVVEVRVGRKWIVVDPLLGLLFRDPVSGELLGKEQLRDPRIFDKVIRGIPHYPRDYRYDRTAYFRLSALPIVGRGAERILNSYFPRWQERIGRPEVLDDTFLRIQWMGLSFVGLALFIRHRLRNRIFREGSQPLSLRWSLVQTLFALLGLSHFSYGARKGVGGRKE